MDQIDKDIEAYEEMKNNLEKDSLEKWVIFHEAKFVGVYDTFEEAAEIATKKFGAGPYLIRQVGVNSITLPVSVMSR